MRSKESLINPPVLFPKGKFLSKINNKYRKTAPLEAVLVPVDTRQSTSIRRHMTLYDLVSMLKQRRVSTGISFMITC